LRRAPVLLEGRAAWLPLLPSGLPDVERVTRVPALLLLLLLLLRLLATRGAAAVCGKVFWVANILASARLTSFSKADTTVVMSMARPSKRRMITTLGVFL
jgi:hypothetical protein